MENNLETKHKPLGMRILAALIAFIASLSVIGDPTFAVKAVDNTVSELTEADEPAEDIQEIDLDAEELIVDDFPDVKARCIPLSEEEHDEVTKSLVASSMKSINFKDNEVMDGFYYGDLQETADRSLKQFTYKYVFTSPEPYEGDTSNYIERSDDFYVKAVLTINTEHILAAGHMELRVPKYLFQERNGGYCEVLSISLSEFSRIPERDANGVYDVEGKWNPSKVVFDYYFDSKTNEYVLVNYDELSSSSNEIEISYRKAAVFDVVNGTEWSVEPKAEIVYDMEKTGALWANGSMVGEGTDNAYFTECVNNSNGEILYMRGEESDDSGDNLNTYCNSQGKPVFVHRVFKNENVNINEWYDVSYAASLADAQSLISERTPLTDAPDITVNTESKLVNRNVSEALSGKIKTDAQLTSVKKSPEPNNSRGYGAQLYTKGQMSKYINVANLDPRVLNGDKLSADYIYTCWRVYTKGTCTQPWSMLFEETPMAARYVDGTNTLITNDKGDVEYYDVNGAIVLGVSTMLQNSYSRRTDNKVGSNSADIQRLYNYVDSSELKDDYWYVADTNSEMRATFGLQNVVKEHKFDIGYYVVVAYPVDELTSYRDDNDTTFYPPFRNKVTAYMFERDGQDSKEIASESSDNIVFKKFEWTGGENYWHTYKRVEGECKDGLISVYDKLVEKGNKAGEYIGDIWFHESYRGGAYSSCHDKSTYKHIDGKYYKIINTDDVITAQPYGEIKYSDDKIKRVYGKPYVLDGSDYFFSKAVLTLSEFEVDPYEDMEYAIDQAAASQKIDSVDESITRDWIVYGWYEGDSDWKEIDLTKFGLPHAHFTLDDYVSLRGSNTLYKLNLNFMDRGEPCPYRLKVEHNCIAYNTRMNWDLETQLKLDSSKFQSGGSLRTGFYDENGDPVTPASFEMFRISLRNYSATKATVYNGHTVESELIDNYNADTGRYINIEGWSERTLVNANRYLWVDMGKMYSDSSYIHCNKDELTKTELGKKLLPSGGLESSYGSSEFLPLKYINGEQTFSGLDDFVAANRHVYRDHAAIDLSILEPDAHAEKFASWENDTRNGQVIMTYTLSGFEGYKLSKELRPLIESLNVMASPEREKIMIYDLLPPGVNYYGFEEPVAGKLTTNRVGDEDSESITYDDVENYFESWDRSKVRLESVDTKENWNGTGRTMVAFTVRFTDTNAILTESNWFVGCGIRFKAYVSWDNYGPARAKDNIFTYAVHESDTHYDGNIYGRWTGTDDSQVFDGAGSVIPSSVGESVDYYMFKDKTLANTRNDKHNRLYGHANDMESVTMARTLGIKKQVRADSDQFAEYADQTSVVKNNTYTYNIHIDKTAQGAAGDIVIFDKIEAISDAHRGGHGTFLSVDLSEIYLNYPKLQTENKVKVWYSESTNSPTALYYSEANSRYYAYAVLTESDISIPDNEKRVAWDFELANNNLVDKDNNSVVDESAKWKEAKNNVVPSTAKSIAVDFGDTVLAEQATLNIYIKMRAPLDISKKFALNEASYYFADYEKNVDGDYVPRGDSFEYSKSEITVVSFGDERQIDVVKNVMGNIPSDLAGKTDFTFRVSSHYYYYKSTIKDKDFDFSNIGYKLKKADEDNYDSIVHTTNSEGEFIISDGEIAHYSSVSAMEFAPTASYDFDNYNITEKSAPYWLSVENVSNAAGDNEHKIVTFKNYYRPVIYLTKKTKGVPAGDDPDTTFSYKIKVYEGESETPVTFSNTAGGYKLLSKTSENDSREDNKLYWYKVAASAGWYETPQGWNPDNDATGLYSADGAEFNDADKSITLTFKSGETVAVPIYIQHIVEGNDVGMLNADGTPRYRITIEEVDDPHWYCTSIEKSGTLGSGENSYIWANNYMFKELLVKKIVTHAPADLSDRAFTFKLTDKSGSPYYSNIKGNVKWTLCIMDQSGKITALSGEDTNGNVAPDGTFTVKGCGNDADSIGNVYVIKLSYLALEDKGKDAEYTVTEILDPNGDFRAVKGSSTVKIKGAALNSTVNIENDYLKRDITIRKIVAAKSMPDTSRKFKMVLCPVGLSSQPAENLVGTMTNKDGISTGITAVPTDTPANGWVVEIGEGCSVTFGDIGKAGDKYELYEKIDGDFLPLTLEIGDNGYTSPQSIELQLSDDYSTDVVNGADGYVVLRKQFIGKDISDITTELDDQEITLALELRKSDGTYVSNLPLNNNEIKVSGNTVSNINNIRLKRNQTVIIHMQAFKDADVSLDGTFRVKEVSYEKQINKDGNWYVIEPDKTDAVWEFDNKTRHGVLVNNVTKFAGQDAIYKRIGFKDKGVVKPTGGISFTIKDSDGTPVQGVKCVAAKYDPSAAAESLTDYKCVSDENGIVSVDLSDSRISNNGWSSSDKNTQYYFKMYFDRAVKINPSSADVLSITENTMATDKSWGAPAGYEIYGNEETYVNEQLLKKNTRTQWTIADADTFVNTQDTEKVAFTKNVTAFSEGDEDMLFRFTVSEFIGSGYQPATHIRYEIYNIEDDITTATPKRTGVTDLDENDLNSGWGVFELKGGEKAVLELPKNAYWQVSEDNTGKYKLVTDDDGNIAYDSDYSFDANDALFADDTSRSDIYNAKYIAQGFEFHTTLDMMSKIPMSYDVVLINGYANANQPMFAVYDESQDSYDMADDGVTAVSRTAKLKSGQTAANNFYYAGEYNYRNAKYGGEYVITNDVKNIYDGDNTSSLMWNYSSGTSSKYRKADLTLPDTVIIENENGMMTEHKIVGIGKRAYAVVSGGLTKVNIPKYVKKIGDNAFNHNFNLKNVDMNRCTELKVIGLCAFADTSADVRFPDTVETIESGAFIIYHNGNKNRNKADTSLVIPSGLRYLAKYPTGNNKLYRVFGDMAEFSSPNLPLRIGSGASIPEMKTGFSYIGDNNDSYIGKVGYLPLNAFHQTSMRWSTIIIGQNDDGVTIMNDFRLQLFRTANDNKYFSGKVIVFPKGKLTLQKGCLMERHISSKANCLRIFQTELEDIDDFIIEDNVYFGFLLDYSLPIFVFTNLERDDAESVAGWSDKIAKLKSGLGDNIQVYYKDDLDDIVDGKPRVQKIIEDVSAVSETEAGVIWDDEVKELLYEAAGLPIPNPLPSPRHLKASEKVISHNDIYLEKKKELLD